MIDGKFHSEKKLKQALRAAENKYMRKIRGVRLTLDRVIGKGYYVYFGFELNDFSDIYLSRRTFPPDDAVTDRIFDIAYDITRRHGLMEGPYITERATHPDCADDSPPFRNLEAKLLHRIVDIQNDLHAWEPTGVRVVERQPERTSGGCEVLLDFQHGINRSRKISVRCFHGYPWSEEMLKECTAWAQNVASDHRVTMNVESVSS